MKIWCWRKKTIKRLNRILSSEKYLSEIKKIEEYEKDRKFCGHGFEHFTAVGRILYILCLENGMDIDKEIAYTIGMLHDVGRGLEYKEGIPHNLGGLKIAEELMRDASYTEEEITMILGAIKSHRKLNEEGAELEKLTYHADKKSRECWRCAVGEECNWVNKNEELIF